MNTIFLENKYQKWYFSIIDRALNERRNYDSSMHEKHHIIPQSLGGQNHLKNIVILTFREHFICHLLLTKMTFLENKSKMHYALRMMMNKSSNNSRKLTQRQYEIARFAFSKFKRKMSSEFCQNQREKKLGNKNPMYGKKQSQKQKDIATKTFSKTYHFILNGEKITVINLKKYCEENNLTRGRMRALYNNKIQKYKNYTGVNFANIE